MNLDNIGWVCLIAENNWLHKMSISHQLRHNFPVDSQLHQVGAAIMDIDMPHPDAEGTIVLPERLEKIRFNSKLRD